MISWRSVLALCLTIACVKATIDLPAWPGTLQGSEGDLAKLWNSVGSLPDIMSQISACESCVGASCSACSQMFSVTLTIPVMTSPLPGPTVKCSVSWSSQPSPYYKTSYLFIASADNCVFSNTSPPTIEDGFGTGKMVIAYIPGQLISNSCALCIDGNFCLVAIGSVSKYYVALD